MLRQGDAIGNYRVVRSIGAGGAGDVYEAFDTKLNRSVALKLLPNEDAVLREARAAAKLDHPNVLAVHDVGVDGGWAYLVTELVRGKTLRELLEEGKPPLDIAVQIASGLAAAHAAGIVHRDLKPENVMVAEDGTVKILDFGIARAATSVSSESETEVKGISGTPGYMAPEQAEGKPVDQRADVFAFGCVLYEMLAGRKPFPDVVALVRDEPKPLKAPEELRKLVERMLRKDPERRLQSMADVRLLLEETLERKMVHVGWKLASAAIAVSALAALLSWPRADAPLALTPVTAAYGREAEPALSPDGRMVAFVWWKEDGEHPALYVKLLDSAAPPLQVAAHAHAPSWSPSGDRIAYLTHVPNDPEQIHHELRVVSAFGGAESTIGRTLSGNHDVSWSPDGERLALLHREASEEPDGVFLMRIAGGGPERLSAPVDPDVDRSPRFSPHGGRLVFIREGARFAIHLASGTADVPVEVFSTNRPIEGLDWTSDGDELVYSSEGRIWTVGLRSKNPKPLAITGAIREIAVARTTRPERLVYRLARSGKDIWSRPLRSTEAGQDRRLIGSTYDDYQPDVSPDGTSIAFLSNRTGTEQIWTCTFHGERCLALTTSAHDKMFPRWSPDAKAIAYTQFEPVGADIYLLDVEGGIPIRLTTDPAIDAAWSWSRDGGHLYFMSTRSGHHEIWRMTESGEDPVQLTEGGGFYPWESADGHLYYKPAEEDAPLWRLPLAGGPAEPATDSRIWREPVLSQEKIFYLGADPGVGTGLESFDLQSARLEKLALLVPDRAGTTPGTFAISPDGETLVYVRHESEGGDLVLAENYRSTVR